MQQHLQTRGWSSRRVGHTGAADVGQPRAKPCQQPGLPSKETDSAQDKSGLEESAERPGPQGLARGVSCKIVFSSSGFMLCSINELALHPLLRQTVRKPKPQPGIWQFKA